MNKYMRLAEKLIKNLNERPELETIVIKMIAREIELFEREGSLEVPDE